MDCLEWWHKVDAALSQQGKRSINRVRQDNVYFQEARAGEQFQGSSAS